MTKQEFWKIIDKVHKASGGDMDKKCELLKEYLMGCDEVAVCSFIDRFDEFDAIAYTWPLWGAAYVLNGGCSDDAFSDFRATLISMGQDIFEVALENPESLSKVAIPYSDGDVDEGDFCYEGFQYVKFEVAEAKLGSDYTSDVAFPSEPTGEEWNEETVEELYPALQAVFESMH